MGIHANTPLDLCLFPSGSSVMVIASPGLPGPGEGFAAVMAKLWRSVIGVHSGASTMKYTSDGRRAVLASGNGRLAARVAKPLVM
jgi:hypothetical protein